jgi:hypothetical protein
VRDSGCDTWTATTYSSAAARARGLSRGPCGYDPVNRKPKGPVMLTILLIIVILLLLFGGGWGYSRRRGV